MKLLVKNIVYSLLFPFATNNPRLLGKASLSMRKNNIWKSTALQEIHKFFARMNWHKYVFIPSGYFSQVVVTKWLTNSYIMPFNSTLIYFMCNDKFILYVFWTRLSNFWFLPVQQSLKFSRATLEVLFSVTDE